jgi:flagellar assembly factor FliW
MGRSGDRSGSLPGGSSRGSPLRVVSGRFGTVEIEAESVLELEEGLVGFPDRRRFARLPSAPGSPFETLLSLDDAELAFSVGDPTRLVPSYMPPLAEAAAALGADAGDVEFLALVAIPEDVREMTIDLTAPIAVDRRRRVGRQLVVADPALDAATKVLPRNR